jgi:hypothetical protein|tara:strand:- start:68 stop:2704 length:2637 start_codon:yes stop_codon:yes gene_type:complete
MKDYNYTNKQFTRDSNNLLQRFNNNEINLETFRTENKNLHSKLSTKEILKNSRGLNAAARLSAIDKVSREYGIDQEKLEKFYDTDLNSECNIINFNLGGDFNTLNQACEFELSLLKGFVDQKFDPNIRDIGVPKIEDIDYSIIKNTKDQRYGEIVQPYKDGILIVRNGTPKGNHFFLVYEYGKENEKIKNVVEPIFRMSDKSYYVNKDIADKLIKHKDNFNVYFCFTKAHKNKVFKINLKKNNKLTRNLEFVSGQDESNNQGLKIYKTFPKHMYDDITKMNGLFDYIDEYNNHMKKAYDDVSPSSMVDIEGFKDFSFKKLKNISKLDLLKASYTFTYTQKVVAFINYMSGYLLNNEGKVEEAMDSFFSNFKQGKSIQDTTNILFKSLNEPADKFLDLIRIHKQNMYVNRVKRENINKYSTQDLLEIFLDLYLMHNYTEEGIKLPYGSYINTDNATQIDCLYYWKYSDFFSTSQRQLNSSDFPLFLEKGEIFNNRNMWEHFGEFRTSPHYPNRYNETYELNKEVKDKVSLILKEAMNQETGLLIPYNACVELQDDFNFRYARFIETEKFIHIFLHDENDRYLSELYCKGEDEFRYWLVNRKQIFDEPENLKKMYDRLYIKLASCIRDWKILIERDSTMTYRGLKIPKGVKSNVARIIYLPRVRYKTNPNKEQLNREKLFYKESRKFSGERRAHIRRLPNGMKPSKTQLVLAESNNVYIPNNYTYVKESIWGKKNMTQRQIRYRTKSLNGLLYCPDQDFKKHEGISEMGPAGFEEHCGKYIESIGYEVYKRQNYDGGIDIRGIKKDGSRIFVQCKHYIKSGEPIGPNVVRELKGSTDLEKKDIEECDIKMMIISSTRYTHKALEAAEKLNIKLMKTEDIE